MIRIRQHTNFISIQYPRYQIKLYNVNDEGDGWVGDTKAYQQIAGLFNSPIDNTTKNPDNANAIFDKSSHKQEKQPVNNTPKTPDNANAIFDKFSKQKKSMEAVADAIYAKHCPKK